MNGIMVDNWFMEEVIADIRDQKIHRSNYYAELLMAIVLWDEVYYPLNKYNWWNSIPSQAQNMLRPLEDEKEDGKNESIKALFRFKGLSEEEFDWLKWREPIVSDPEDIISSGAIRYLALSGKNGLDYLPCVQRQNFLRKYCGADNMRISLSRMNLQGDLTKTIKEYYVETYKALIDFSSLEIKMPVLANFIIDNAARDMTPVDFAFHLKNEGAVIKYRNYLRELEIALEKQNWKELRHLLRCSEDAVNSVISMDRNRLNGISVSFFPTPAIILKNNKIEASISSSPSLTIGEIGSRKFNLTFLRDITKYAINDMRVW